MPDVNTFYRLDRLTRAFVPTTSSCRMLASPTGGGPFAERLEVSSHGESSTSDTMHKLVLVEDGELDLEGDSGGWLILPGHMIFIPAERAFAMRSAPRTRLIVAHLDPGDAAWSHHGCWMTAVPSLAHEMLAHALRWRPAEIAEGDGSRLFFRSLSHLCREWFATPRILWLPLARSAEVKAAVAYLRDHLEEAKLEGAAEAAGCSPRTLQRRCRGEFGFSWRAFVREVRIMRAMELLACGRQGVGSAARATGFRSLTTFTVSFSERVGVSPSSFARRLQTSHFSGFTANAAKKAQTS